MCDIKFINALDSQGRSMAETPTLQDLIRQDINPDGSVKLDRYTEDDGFHSIANPGWVKFELDDVYEISYIRFLLWDSCGNGKRQPSHRSYQYRLMYSTDSISSDSANWIVLYDTMRNGSNGWQEFYLEDNPIRIRSIKIQCCSNTRNSETQLIKVQVYRHPTKELAQEYSLDIPAAECAPSIHGIINNRIICGYNEEAGISKSIYNEISSKLKLLGDTIGNNDEDIKAFSLETQEKLGELNRIDNDISKFQSSLLEPVEDEIKKQKEHDRKLRTMNIIVMWLAIVTILVDFTRLILAWLR